MLGRTHRVALVERAETAMPDVPFIDRSLADPGMVAILRDTCRRINYRLR
jgi:hypothetical protein